MQRQIVTLVLAVSIGFGLLILGASARAWRLPGDNQGYAPVQPIAYSHQLHAGELGIQCLYCHSGAEHSRHAGVPSAEICMNCHQFISAPVALQRAEDELAQKEQRSPRRIVSTELKKLYDALGLDDQLQPRPGQIPQPIAWQRVHHLPDFVSFDHRAHVAAGVTCQHCHGPIETMQRVRQESSLSMGWCVQCHRDATAQGVNGRPAQASTDCATCHF